MGKFNLSDAKRIGNDLGIDWNEVNLKEFTMRVNVELEHGTRYFETNVTDDDRSLTGKIAWAAPITRKYPFTGLLPRGGIVMGLALMMQKDPQFNTFSAILVSTIMGATIIYEFAGPLLARWGLTKAGELQQ